MSDEVEVRGVVASTWQRISRSGALVQVLGGLAFLVFVFPRGGHVVDSGRWDLFLTTYFVRANARVHWNLLRYFDSNVTSQVSPRLCIRWRSREHWLRVACGWLHALGNGATGVQGRRRCGWNRV